MLGRIDRDLPEDVLHIIISRLDRRDQVRLMKTCRSLFKFTVPYVWRSISLVVLLELLSATPFSLGDSDNLTAEVCFNNCL